MEKLKNIVEKIWSLILPQDPETLRIENLSIEEIMAEIPAANPLPDEKYKAVFQYKDKMMRRAIWEIKYRGNKKIAAKFSQLLYDFILEEISEDTIFANFHNPLLLPIPASKKTLRERGFNQCELIVKEIEKCDTSKNFEINFFALRKIKETPHQSKSKNKTERLKNLKESFSANSEIVHGRNIILIDDVITTGTTMHEAAKTLRQAGAKKVIGFAIAH